MFVHGLVKQVFLNPLNFIERHGLVDSKNGEENNKCFIFQNQNKKEIKRCSLR